MPVATEHAVFAYKDKRAFFLGHPVYLQVLVKLVYKIFPWNRRARRRVLGDVEEEEL